MTTTSTNLKPEQVQEQKTVEVARKIDAGEGTPEHDVLEIADYYTVLARRVHQAWRDGMLEQGREVAPHRMAWESLGFQDQALDVFIGREVAREAFRLLATLTQPSAASAGAGASGGAGGVRRDDTPERSYHQELASADGQVYASIEVEADAEGHPVPVGLTVHRGVLLEAYGEDEADVVLALSRAEARALARGLEAAAGVE